MTKQDKMFKGYRHKFSILDPADDVSHPTTVRLSIERFVGDGDTVDLKAAGRLPVRFLGIDAAEKGFFRPLRSREKHEKQTGYMPLTNELWDDFLTDPFSDEWKPFSTDLHPGLKDDLMKRLGPTAAQNHRDWAQKARERMIQMVEEDLRSTASIWEDAAFFTKFGSEILDGYGRLLCFINISEEDRDLRPKYSYNERLLKEAFVTPYFIWPNIDPFRKQESIISAAKSPEEMRRDISGSRNLKSAREWVSEARENEMGIMHPQRGLKILSFELRYLAQRIEPKRYVIDLSAEEQDNRILPPRMYFKIPHPEDRLFIPREYVPLLKENGWRVENTDSPA